MSQSCSLSNSTTSNLHESKQLILRGTEIVKSCQKIENVVTFDARLVGLNEGLNQLEHSLNNITIAPKLNKANVR